MIGQGYGIFLVVVALVWAGHTIVTWAKGVGRSDFAIVLTPQGVWLPAAIEKKPVSWEDVQALETKTLRLSYRLRPDWDSSRSSIPWAREDGKCEVEVLELVREGEDPAQIPLDELSGPVREQFVRQLIDFWKNPATRAEDLAMVNHSQGARLS